jgi:hypothetical protein
MEATPMSKFQVIRTDYPMEVHAVGCRDLTRKRHSLDWTIEGDTVELAVASEAKQINNDFESEYSNSELFRVMPCCKGVA